MRRPSNHGWMDSRPGYYVTIYKPVRKSVIGARLLVGEVGRSIIKKLPRAATWDEVKRELCDILGEADPKEQAIKGLLQYKPKEKGLGRNSSRYYHKSC